MVFSSLHKLSSRYSDTLSHLYQASQRAFPHAWNAEAPWKTLVAHFIVPYKRKPEQSSQPEYKLPKQLDLNVVILA